MSSIPVSGILCPVKQTAKQLSLYLETSVWNFVYAEDAPEKQKSTLEFFEEVKLGFYRIFISDLVLAEIRNAPEPKREKLEALIRHYRPTCLETKSDVETLAGAYLKAKIVSERFSPDVLHAAYATAYDVDGLVSWNLEHLVRLKTRLAIQGINRQLGYKEIEIVTPEEVIGYGV